MDIQYLINKVIFDSLESMKKSQQLSDTEIVNKLLCDTYQYLAEHRDKNTNYSLAGQMLIRH